jgi:hypothetical protein
LARRTHILSATSPSARCLVRLTRKWLNQIRDAQPERDPGQDYGTDTRKYDNSCKTHAILLRALNPPAQPVPVGHLSQRLSLRICTSSSHAGTIELFQMRRNLGDDLSLLGRREIEMRQSIGDKPFKVRHQKTSPDG